MAALEEDIGGPVLVRRGRGVELTPLGHVLLEHTQILLDAEQHALAAVDRAREHLDVELQVGVFCNVAAGLIPLVAEDLNRRHPRVRVKTREIDPDDATLELRHGHLDVAFLIDYPDAAEPWRAGVLTTPVGFDTLHLAAPHGRYKQSVVDLADLAHENWIMSGPESYFGRALRTACRNAGFDPVVAHQVVEQPTALAMVAAGLGVTLMSDLGRSFLPVEGISTHRLRRPVRRQILIGYDEATQTRPAVQALLRSVKRAVPEAGLSKN